MNPLEAIDESLESILTYMDERLEDEERDSQAVLETVQKRLIILRYRIQHTLTEV